MEAVEEPTVTDGLAAMDNTFDAQQGESTMEVSNLAVEDITDAVDVAFYAKHQLLIHH